MSAERSTPSELQKEQERLRPLLEEALVKDGVLGRTSDGDLFLKDAKRALRIVKILMKAVR